MLRNSFVAGLCMCVAASGLYASSVSFMIAETGMSQGSADDRYSALWESSLMEAFFESGHIVSSAPRIRLAEPPPPNGFPHEAKKDYEDAGSGGMDYFLVAIVDIASRDVSLRLFSTRDMELVAHKTYTAATPARSREESESIGRAAREMAAFLR